MSLKPCRILIIGCSVLCKTGVQNAQQNILDAWPMMPGNIFTGEIALCPSCCLDIKIVRNLISLVQFDINVMPVYWCHADPCCDIVIVGVQIYSRWQCQISRIVYTILSMGGSHVRLFILHLDLWTLHSWSWKLEGPTFGTITFKVMIIETHNAWHMMIMVYSISTIQDSISRIWEDWLLHLWCSGTLLHLCTFWWEEPCPTFLSSKKISVVFQWIFYLDVHKHYPVAAAEKLLNKGWWKCNLIVLSTPHWCLWS